MLSRGATALQHRPQHGKQKTTLRAGAGWEAHIQSGYSVQLLALRRRRRRRHSLHTTRCAHAMRTCSAAQATRALTASYSTASTPSSPTLPTPTTEAGPFFRCCGVLLPRAPSTFITALPTASGTSAPLTQRAVASTPRVERVRPIRVQQAARISLADGKCGADPPTRAPVLSLGRASLHTISCVLATVCLSLDSPTQT